jgi:hypothetical protein
MRFWGGREGRGGVVVGSRQKAVFNKLGNGQATHGRVTVTPSLVVILMNTRFLRIDEGRR